MNSEERSADRARRRYGRDALEIGRDPTVRGSVVAYLALLSIVAIVHLLLLARANAVAAWRRPMPAELFPCLLAWWQPAPQSPWPAWPSRASCPSRVW